jgi:hypothetical protein
VFLTTFLKVVGKVKLLNGERCCKGIKFKMLDPGRGVDVTATPMGQSVSCCQFSTVERRSV